MKTLSALLILTALLASTPCRASGTERFVIDTLDQFEEGNAKSTSITEDGTLERGISSTVLAEIKDTNIWSAAINPKTREMIVATGSKGEVLAFDSQGKKRLLAKLPEPEVYALAITPTGQIFAATSPKGKIYRIDPSGGKFEVYFDPKEELIWSLVSDANGVLYAGTGNRGNIYRITAKDKGEVYYDSDSASIRSLAFDKDGHLLAGTAGKAYLYLIKAKDSAVALASSSQNEISDILTAKDGTIYYVANENSKETSIQTIIHITNHSTTSISGDSPAVPKAPASTLIFSSQSSSSDHKSKFYVYRIQSDLFPQEMGSQSGTAYSLLELGGRILISTGGEGSIYAVDHDLHWTRLGGLDSEQITALLPQSETSFLGLGSNQGRLFSASLESSSPSIYLSKILDSKLFAHWGTLQVEGSGHWQIRTRSGNTPDPDKSWYDWQDLKNGKVASPPGRYIQIEVDLSFGSVNRLCLNYLNQNLPPIIKHIEVLDPGIGYKPMNRPPTQANASTIDNILRGATSFEMKPSFLPEFAPGLRTVLWQAADPNDDDLLYTVEIRNENDHNWTILKDKLDVPIFSWDTSAWPEGHYYIRVTASDIKSNTPKTALTTRELSEVFTIAHTPPIIRLGRQTPTSVEFSVQATVSRLEEVSVSSDGNEYHSILPLDGILDEATEDFEVTRKANEPLFIRAKDEVGNISGMRIPPNR